MNFLGRARLGNRAYLHRQQSQTKRSTEGSQSPLLQIPFLCSGKAAYEETPTHIGQRAQVIENSFGQTALPKQRLLQARSTSLLQSPQRSHKVTAVDGGNEVRRQWFQRARVVPIQEMTALFGWLATRQSTECALGLRSHFRNNEITKFTSNLLRVQQES